jgi:hypothetical protein
MKNEIFEVFIEVLEQSVKNHGPDKAMTLGHLLNLAKLSKKIWSQREDKHVEDLDKVKNDIFYHGQ